MSRNIITHLKAGETIEEYFLLKTCEAKQTNQTPPKDYLDLQLADQGGEINGKMWDSTPTDKDNFHQCKNMVVKIKARVTTYKNDNQLTVEYIKIPTPEENVGITEFIPSAPIHPDDMIKRIYQHLETLENQDMKSIVSEIIKGKEENLKKYPAAKKIHHAIYGGLAYHILCMLDLADSVIRLYPTLNRDLLISGVILHDLCKIDEFEDEYCSDYSIAGKLIGHISLMNSLIQRTAEKLAIKGEVPILLQHMVLSHHGKLEYGSPVQPLIKEAEILHHIDMIDAKMYAMDDSIGKSSKDDDFTEPIRALNNRKLYKPSL